ncbi:hypothetical protein BDN70DRAFT_880642 [Pholiota conissans]|uniref:Uncharacterized protein n=1 Tax=Pholiota conissans TaxID=109636 RepID=A0A9P5YYK3_9AGAR|nr:hypothetical protein BDN70DRAFT_880642 [Pholiota conissans]
MTLSRKVTTAQPVPSKLVKKVEKEILSEAKNEERRLKNAIEDLSQIEKAENKAQKAIVRADKALDKAEKKEQRTLKDLYRAEHTHGVALSNVRKAQKELEASTKMHSKMAEALREKAARVEQSMKVHDQNNAERNVKLDTLRDQFPNQLQTIQRLPEAAPRLHNAGVQN